MKGFLLLDGGVCLCYIQCMCEPAGYMLVRFLESHGKTCRPGKGKGDSPFAPSMQQDNILLLSSAVNRVKMGKTQNAVQKLCFEFLFVIFRVPGEPISTECNNAHVLTLMCSAVTRQGRATLLLITELMF